jgi:hypothetical protein
MNSSTEAAVIFGFTSSTFGIAAITLIGTNRVESYPSFG